MRRKTITKNFNNTVLGLCRVRRGAGNTLTLPERCNLLSALRDVCKTLGANISVKADNVAFGKIIEQTHDEEKKFHTDWQLTHRNLKNRARNLQLEAHKAQGAAFGLLDFLIATNKEKKFVAKRMGKKNRLEICLKAKQHLERAILLDIQWFEADTAAKKTAPAVSGPATRCS